MFSASGSLVYTCLDSSVAITPFPAGEHPIHSLHVSSVSCCTLDLDPKGRYIAVGSNDAVVTLFETTDWTLVQSLGHFECVNSPFPRCSFTNSLLMFIWV